MSKKILLVYKDFSSFVRTDYEILSSKFRVDKYHFKPAKGIFSTATQFAKQFFYLLLHIWKIDSVYIWFADYHSFLPVMFAKILRKKAFLVIGGYDVCRIPKLKYGVFLKKYRGFFALTSMKHSSINLTVSKFVDRIVKNIAPNARRTLLYNCINISNPNTLMNNQQKENIILTVGLINNEQTFYRKGIDTFVKIARLLPDYQFICVGFSKEALKHLINDIPENLHLFNRVEQPQLIDYYKRAKIYAQFSRMDTFCLTIAEAMQYNCIPVVTNVGGMPEVVGKAGFIMKHNAKIIAQTITDIMDNKIYPKENRQKRIETMFKLENRMKNIYEILNQHIN